MSLEIVKKFATENENQELLSAVSAIESSQKANLDRIAYLEKENQNAISKRDRQASLVKEKLGIDELSDDALDSFLSKTSKKGSTEFEAEKKSLEEMIASLQGDKQGLAEALERTKNQYGVERKLMELGAAKEVNGSKAFGILLDEATRGASFEDGKVVFKAEDGTTIRNADGTPMGLAERYASLKESDDFGFLFVEPKGKGGSGSGSSKGGNQGITSLEGLDYKQRLALHKQDPELFKKLSEKG